MDTPARDQLMQRFLQHRSFAAGTLDAYRLALRDLANWADAQSVSFESATTTDLWEFREWLRARRLSPNTVNTRFKNVRSFYDYLRRTGVIAVNPAADIKITEVALAGRTVLTLDELAAMWDASGGVERIIVGLAGLCSVRRSELREARVKDLHSRAGMTALAIPGRAGSMNDLGFVTLPDLLAVEMDRYLDGRRTGFLLRAVRGDAGAGVALTFINQVVKRVGRRAGLPFPVTTLALTQTLRYLALENRFSYVSVVRTASHGSVLLRNEMIRDLDLPPEEHASVQLGQMLAARSSADEEMLLRAEHLLSDRSQHPSASTMVASATLERALRKATSASGISVAKKDPTLGTYGALLRSSNLISVAQLRTIERILGFRNHAAHGWFELVTRDDAEWILHEARALIAELRTIQTADQPA
jgi:site-specific recombinase XerD